MGLCCGKPAETPKIDQPNKDIKTKSINTDVESK